MPFNVAKQRILRTIFYRSTTRPCLHSVFRSQQRTWANKASHLVNGIGTLAIETSCDDTSVAIVESDFSSESTGSLAGHRAYLLFHKKVTSNNHAYRGVHPIIALESHQSNLALLVDEAVRSKKSFRPDFVSVTQGPGMRSNLQTGIDTAKGLAVAWQVPLVGVHHMQAHALTPRFISALSHHGEKPTFPFLSLLVSGGHTMIILSKSLTDHVILASTVDTALGDCLDKAARAVLPPSVLDSAKGTMYGALLERFAFPQPSYSYTAPRSLSEEQAMKPSKYGWALKPPFSNSPKGEKARALQLSFTGLATAVERFATNGIDAHGKLLPVHRAGHSFSEEERRNMAQETMRVAFEHLVGRTILALDHLQNTEPSIAEAIDTVVVSGGVAANGYLRHILPEMLKARKYSNLEVMYPPIEYCTDNAAMIGWAGLEMFAAGHRTELSIRGIRKWPMDTLLNPPSELLAPPQS